MGLIIRRSGPLRPISVRIFVCSLSNHVIQHSDGTLITSNSKCVACGYGLSNSSNNTLTGKLFFVHTMLASGGKGGSGVAAGVVIGHERWV